MLFEVLLAARSPAQRHLHGIFGARVIGGMLGALVEGHDDVGAKTDLRSDGTLRAEKVRGAVEVRAKGYAVLGDFAQIAEAENLEAAGVGEDRAIPRHEILHAAKPADGLDSGPEIKMIGVVKKNLDAEFFERILRNTLDRADCADGHEDRRLDFAVRRGESTGAGAAIAGFNLEAKRHCFDCSDVVHH